jgi:hypothetical protein
LSRPASEWVGRSYKSLERPAEYFGCHINIGILSIIMIMGCPLSFLFTDFVTGLLITLAGIFLAGVVVKTGRMLSAHDPYWPDALIRHFYGDKYLDV